MPDDNDLLARFAVAERVAGAAGRLTLEYFGKTLAVERKSDNSPVTVADREAEQLLRAEIQAAFPDDGILGEEFPERPGSSPFRWVLDPIDGTKSFMAGVPLYATLVAVEFEQRATIGVIQLPALGESVSAAEGHGAWFVRPQGLRTPARVGNYQALADGLFLTSERKSFDERGATDVYRQLEEAAWVTRTWGDAYGYALVATGRAILMVDALMNVWDAAAIQPILREAGGIFCDWQGESSIHHGEGIGTVPGVLEEVLRITRGRCH